MNRNRLLVILMAALMGWAVPEICDAIDVNPVRGKELREAKAFFTHLASTSKNPLIVSMAEESLKKIDDNNQANRPGDTRNRAEVTLLPQSDNTFVVPALVNRRHMATFLVDTGASYTVITPQMARELGIHIPADHPTLPVTTANGTLNAPVVTLKQVTLGGMQVNNVEAVITDLGDTPQLSGLLGMSFFRGMDLSFKQDKLVISR
ncbi:retropepsin-like aspartic protease family protein [Vampirovibrio chlorellavorus]|uniref:retropepsin-like aspartic protease family protein n=1 Tax=Vampirovibrio chlorellavorus TaxID=758823 RepID=UPI0026F313E6|nr:retropepsin-like aspartic protease [Vampirovibrio chlorellavorus]